MVCGGQKYQRPLPGKHPSTIRPSATRFVIIKLWKGVVLLSALSLATELRRARELEALEGEVEGYTVWW